MTTDKARIAELNLLLDKERAARIALQNAAENFAAHQGNATDARVGIVQPVSVADCEALNAALALAAKLP